MQVSTILKILGVVGGTGLAIFGFKKMNDKSQVAAAASVQNVVPSTTNTTAASVPSAAITDIALANSATAEEVAVVKVTRDVLRQELIANPASLYGNALAVTREGIAYWLDGAGKWVLLETVASPGYEEIMSKVSYVFCINTNADIEELVAGELNASGNSTYIKIASIDPMQYQDVKVLVQAMINAGV